MAKKSFNFKTGLKATLVAFGMFGFGYALIPLYDLFCDLTGINQLQTADAEPTTGIITDRQVRVEFDTNSHGDNISMTPSVLQITINPGKTHSVIYNVTNNNDFPVVGQAVPSYAPRHSSDNFKKIQCFCFDQMTLAAHEVKTEPVVFYITEDLEESIHSIALSYSFFTIVGQTE